MKAPITTVILLAIVSFISIPSKVTAQVALPLKIVLEDQNGQCKDGNDVEVTLIFRKGNTNDFVSANLNRCFKKASLNYHLLYPSYGGNFANFGEEDVWGLQIGYNNETFFASKQDLLREKCWDLKFGEKSVKFHFSKGRWVISVL